MEIRRATKNDINEIQELLSQVDMVHHLGRPDLFKIGRKYNEEELTEIIADDMRPIFVATDENDKTVGYAFCIHQQHINDNILTDIKTLYIDDLCVYEHMRNGHIGRKLYDYVIDYARNSGCYNVTLNVWYENKSAMAFYEKMGMGIQKMGMETIL